ncbi:aspartate/alanine exchanger family protein [Streptomyces albidoflavus]|nr:aspartate/alanine exchanger family protein [Streptomyces albidoflavus]
MGMIRDHPELALFLSLAAGYLLGKLRVGPITLGGICGTLIVSLLLGTQHVSVGDDVRSVFFALFIFSLGYMAGPSSSPTSTGAACASSCSAWSSWSACSASPSASPSPSTWTWAPPPASSPVPPPSRPWSARPPRRSASSTG